jgi:hypothetical protein
MVEKIELGKVKKDEMLSVKLINDLLKKMGMNIKEGKWNKVRCDEEEMEGELFEN